MAMAPRADQSDAIPLGSSGSGPYAYHNAGGIVPDCTGPLVLRVLAGLRRLCVGLDRFPGQLPRSITALYLAVVIQRDDFRAFEPLRHVVERALS